MLPCLSFQAASRSSLLRRLMLPRTRYPTLPAPITCLCRLLHLPLLETSHTVVPTTNIILSTSVFPLSSLKGIYRVRISFILTRTGIPTGMQLYQWVLVPVPHSFPGHTIMDGSRVATTLSTFPVKSPKAQSVTVQARHMHSVQCSTWTLPVCSLPSLTL